MFKQFVSGSALFCLATAASPISAQGLHCAARDLVVERLESKYSEALTAGGLQGAATGTTSLVEVWASEKTGTFTVIMTNPQGVSCIVAAGTDWHREKLSTKGGINSSEVPL